MGSPPLGCGTRPKCVLTPYQNASARRHGFASTLPPRTCNQSSRSERLSEGTEDVALARLAHPTASRPFSPTSGANVHTPAPTRLPSATNKPSELRHLRPARAPGTKAASASSVAAEREARGGDDHARKRIEKILGGASACGTRSRRPHDRARRVRRGHGPVGKRQNDDAQH